MGAALEIDLDMGVMQFWTFSLSIVINPFNFKKNILN
jgi:hypothetical protein